MHGFITVVVKSPQERVFCLRRGHIASGAAVRFAVFLLDGFVIARSAACSQPEEAQREANSLSRLARRR